ncbi:peptide chain release factor N(5)-glutamine methyltransferase, partial [Candidatus Aerophobetes bacterium]|nr:peptide chain release factor N(5)-glutamine methyltransferase [Candidatus Aerophobetes bacterium]
KKEPLQYILGECYFYNIKIKVGRGVLIPRPETEILVEQVLERRKLIINTGNRILDLCTGSGCIALAIGKNVPEFQIFGIDKSEKAVKYATENKALNNIKNVIFLVGDMFNPFKEKIFACITANPPYVKTDEISKLQPEIKNYEPLEALNGGEDGLNFYRKIIENAEKYLLNSGLIFLEIGQGQAKAVQNIALMSGFNVIEVVKDIAGIDRVMILQKSKSL